MPRAPKKCGNPTCSEMAPPGRGYCPTHVRNGGWQKQTRWPYNDPRYKPWRKAVLEASGGRCQLTLPGCTTRGTQSDHRIPVSARPDLAFEVGNGQAACENCHKIKTQRESAAARRSN